MFDNSFVLGAIVTAVAVLAVVAILFLAYRFVNGVEWGNRRYRRFHQLLGWRRSRAERRPDDRQDEYGRRNSGE